MTDTPTPVTEFMIVEAMSRYGGHFARAIAEAATRADDDNLTRLHRAFPELWAEYAELARLRRERDR